jgi:hypothetical protein
MHYLFFDESYRVEPEKALLIAAWAVEQQRLNWHVDELPRLYKTPIMGEILRLFDALGAHAVVTQTALSAEFWQPNQVDGTRDIPSMARTDNIWSMCAIFTVASLIAELIIGGEHLGTVDIHFDPKDLTTSHETAVEKTLRDQLAPQAKRLVPDRFRAQLVEMRIRRITSVTKAPAGHPRDKFQTGTWIADRLCAHREELRESGGSVRVKLEDITEVVRNTAQRFDGKS